MVANANNGLLVQAQAWNNHPLFHPLNILVLNLMPTKKQTELQFLTLLDNLSRDVQVTFMYPATHHFKTTNQTTIQKHYVCLQQIQQQFYDGLIISGAPVETIPFQQVDYWQELLSIRKWAQQHVKQTINECWACQAGLYQDFNINKHSVSSKIFGIYTGRGDPAAFAASIKIPQSWHSQSNLDNLPLPTELQVLFQNDHIGPLVLQSKAKHQTYITGHPEYFTDTLDQEYQRDLQKGCSINPPINYYDHHQIKNTCLTSSIKLYQN